MKIDLQVTQEVCSKLRKRKMADQKQIEHIETCCHCFHKIIATGTSAQVSREGA